MLTLYSYFSSFPRYPRDFLHFSSDWNKKLDIARNRLSNSNVLGCNLGDMWNKSPQKYYKICLVSFASPAPFCVNLSCFQPYLFSTFPVFNLSCFISSLRTHALTSHGVLHARSKEKYRLCL